MISTGNDIVALNAINIARSKQPNFYKKIISDAEKTLYDQQLSDQLSFDNFVWLSWSIKESAYKYLQRITPELVFSPTRIVASRLTIPQNNTLTQLAGRNFDDLSTYKGVIAFGDQVLYSRSVITEEFIFSAVNNTDNFESVYWGVQMMDSSEPEYQSRSVRTLLSERLHILFPDDDWQIAKSAHGYPILLENNRVTDIPVSLTHHDRYAAYSFQLKDGRFSQNQ